METTRDIIVAIVKLAIWILAAPLIIAVAIFLGLGIRKRQQYKKEFGFDKPIEIEADDEAD